MKTEKPKEQTDTYRNLLDLAAIVADAENRVAELEADLNDEMLSAVDERRAYFAKLQQSITEATASLELLAVKNPDWFGGKQSLKTLYGTLQFKRSTSLEVGNEELSIALIKRDITFAAADNDASQLEFLASLLRVNTALNLEALGEVDDAMLAKYKVKRVEKTNFSFKPAKIDLGKAVKESAEKVAA